MEHIRKAFDEAASQYDSQRIYIIPEMEEFYNAAVWAAEWEGDRPAILDIGAGTGLLTALLLNKYTGATATLMDCSEQMLDLARKRFADRKNVRFITGDYSIADLSGPYDLICSALSIHHLPHDEKRSLYGRINDSLNPGGVFVNADQVLGESSGIQKRFIEYWDGFVRGGPLTPQEIEEIRTRRDTLDKTERLGVQLGWLRESGFSEVDVIYKNRMLVVFMGRKG